MSPSEGWHFPEYPADWDDRRKHVLSRDGYRCQGCGSSRGPFQVHHLVSLSDGGTDHPTNLITLCQNCHAQRHPHMGDVRDSDVGPSRLRTFSAQLGVTSAQLRDYEEKHGLIDTAFTRPLRTAEELQVLESPRIDKASLFVPARRPPNGRSRAKAANLVKFALLALLVVVNR